MKIIDVLELMNEYDCVRIHGANNLDWNEDNPYILEATKVKELGWLTVRTLAPRDVIEISSDMIERNGVETTCITLVYR